MNEDRAWVAHAIHIIEADFNRSADTHLLRVPLPGTPEIALYLKDESTHPTGSLKHRLARSLFLYGLCNGWIGPKTPILEASSGSTAVSEAYFARMLGLRFIAVVPRSTSAEKVAQIGFYGGEIHSVEMAADIYGEAPISPHRLAAITWTSSLTRSGRRTGAATTTSPNRSSLKWAMKRPVPAWIVVGAGTGGTSATVGRYIRYRRLSTRLCLADPEASVFHRHFADRNVSSVSGSASLIEGIGRPRCEPSFNPDLIDCAYAVSDESSIAAARVLSEHIGRSCGGSTGTSIWAAAHIIGAMADRGEKGSVVALLCDSGERYRSTILNDVWLAERRLDISREVDAIRRFFETGILQS